MIAGHLCVLGDGGHKLICSSFVGEMERKIGQRHTRNHSFDRRDLDTSQTISVVDDDQDLLYGFSPVALARLCIPKRELCENPLIFTIDRTRFLSYPTIADGIVFTLVFTFPSQPILHNQPLYLDIIRRISLSLKEEHNRCQYLTSAPSTYLQKDLDSIVQGLFLDNFCTVYINNWMRVSCCLNPVPIDGSVHPHQTLLISSEDILDKLPNDCTPCLSFFVQHCSPMKSFQELSLDLDIPLSVCYSISSHLQYWGLGKIIDTLNKHNMYTLTSKRIDFALEKEFAQRFPSMNFYTSLSRFSEILPLEEHLRGQTAEGRKKTVSLLVWLLQNHVIEQLFTFVYCFMDQYPSEASIPRNAQSLPSLKDFNQIAPKTAQRLFSTLRPLFNGKHSMEDIMRTTRISRSDLLRILSEYRDVLQTCLYSKS